MNQFSRGGDPVVATSHLRLVSRTEIERWKCSVVSTIWKLVTVWTPEGSRSVGNTSTITDNTQASIKFTRKCSNFPAAKLKFIFSFSPLICLIVKFNRSLLIGLYVCLYVPVARFTSVEHPDVCPHDKEASLIENTSNKTTFSIITHRRKHEAVQHHIWRCRWSTGF